MRKRILHHARLNGPIFDQDLKKEMWIIKELSIGTPLEACIKHVKCGRVAMQKLQKYYDGKSEEERQNNTGKGGAQLIALLP